jgi:hypothetical protein
VSPPSRPAVRFISKAWLKRCICPPVQRLILSHSPILHRNGPGSLLTILPTSYDTTTGTYELDSANIAKSQVAPLQASPLSSPSSPTRRLPHTRSRSQLSSRASLESIIEESSGDSLEHPPTHATNPVPELTGEKERTGVTISRPLSWNGKKGITAGRGMRDVCGIWCVHYSVPFHPCILTSYSAQL